MALEQEASGEEYDSLLFCSENIWRYLKFHEWVDEGAKYFHIFLLEDRLLSAMEGASYRDDQKKVGTLNFSHKENYEDYRVLVMALPGFEELGYSVLEGRIRGYVQTLKKLLGDQHLSDSENSELFKLCIALNILSRARVPPERLQTIAA